MIAREKLIRKLREIRFSFHREAPNTYIYKRGQDRIHLQKHALFDEDYVRTLLLGHGVPAAEAETFIRNERS